MYRQARVLSAAAFLFFLSLVLTAYSVRNPETARMGSRLYQTFTGPVQGGVHTFWERSTTWWNSYIWLVNTAEKSRELESELVRLRAETIRLRSLSEENASLRKVLSFKEATGYNGMVAAVIGYDPTGWLQTITIGKGRENGLREQLPTIQAGAVVGQVSAAAANTAQVLLLTDRASGVGGLVQRSRARGVVIGTGSRKCRFDYVLEDDDVVVGDIVVTSGMDGIFPKGLEIGRVIKVEDDPNEVFKSIRVEPSVDFAHLESVFVVTQYEIGELGE